MQDFLQISYKHEPKLLRFSPRLGSTSTWCLLMAGGLAALLDDIASIAKAAASSIDDIAASAGRTSAKAAGVVIDDTAVTPRYVRGIAPARELPIIWSIAKGSLVNKLVIILPAALLLSWLAPWLLTPILMLGGSYLCFEGAEKIVQKLRGHTPEKPVVDVGSDSEDKLVRGATTIDLVLSAEIIVISLKDVASEPFAMRSAVLIMVAMFITALVYGVVAILVKMDDIGLRLSAGTNTVMRKLGLSLVSLMPKVLTAIAFIGTFAMMWVGGHLLLVGADELGWHEPYAVVHHIENLIVDATTVEEPLGWIVNTFCSLVIGLIWGTIIVGIRLCWKDRED